jgi:hypothetical protein
MTSKSHFEHRNLSHARPGAIPCVTSLFVSGVLIRLTAQVYHATVNQRELVSKCAYAKLHWRLTLSLLVPPR